MSWKGIASAYGYANWTTQMSSSRIAMVKSIPAAKFKEQCLAILDDLDEEGVIVTKRGKPVARVVPIRPEPKSFIGSIPDLIVDPDDPLLSTGLVWEAELPDDPVERANFITERQAMAHRWAR